MTLGDQISRYVEEYEQTPQHTLLDLIGRLITRKVNFAFPGDYGHSFSQGPYRALDTDPNVVTSAHNQSEKKTTHALLLDLDVPAYLVPSSTPGHSHLYVDVEIDHDRWKLLIHALADAGVIEKGYAEASINRGASYLRLPWVKKQEGEVLTDGTRHDKYATPKGNPEGGRPQSVVANQRVLKAAIFRRKKH